ncbi:MAG: hypothetical protein JXA21_19060 [Anaerolineae bacterium]|nr:hypothetical protein [Anaerolineae bacterium]
MNNRERVRAILRYEAYERMPVVYFGYWNETLGKWADEGHITREEAGAWSDGNPDRSRNVALQHRAMAGAV